MTRLEVHPAPRPARRAEHFADDANGNLTQATDRKRQVTSVSYDAAGRRTTVGGSFARTGLPAPLSSAAYDAANQLTAWGGTALSYDANGNLTSDGATSYTWDARDRLTAISGPVPAGFAYDALGRRTGKTINYMIGRA